MRGMNSKPVAVDTRGRDRRGLGQPTAFCPQPPPKRQAEAVFTKMRRWAAGHLDIFTRGGGGRRRVGFGQRGSSVFHPWLPRRESRDVCGAFSAIISTGSTGHSTGSGGSDGCARGPELQMVL